MKTYRTPNRRALAALFPATLMLAAPSFAQEVQTVTPPPVVTAAPPSPTVQSVTPPRVVPTVPATPVPEKAVPTPEATAPAARRAPTSATRSPAARPPAARPVAAAPISAPAPVEAPLVTVASPPPVAEAAAPVTPGSAPRDEASVETTTTTSNVAPIWPWIVGGLLVIGAIALFLLRRRRPIEEDYYDEVAYVEPQVAPAMPLVEREPQFLRPGVIAPVAVAPAFVPTEAQAGQTASEEAVVATPDDEDLAALTSANAPVGNRPWLEFSMRPLRAGTNVDEAMVEIELTIGNAGSIAAEDVRVSTFMFASGPGEATGMERNLIERDDASSVPPMTIAPGEGTRVDATLALPKAELMARSGDTFSPVVVADARYTLPDGSEGRTSASFRIGLSDMDGAAMTPFPVDGKTMREDIEAELYGTPEHA